MFCSSYLFGAWCGYRADLCLLSMFKCSLVSFGWTSSSNFLTGPSFLQGVLTVHLFSCWLNFACLQIFVLSCSCTFKPSLAPSASIRAWRLPWASQVLPSCVCLFLHSSSFIMVSWSGTSQFLFTPLVTLRSLQTRFAASWSFLVGLFFLSFSFLVFLSCNLSFWQPFCSRSGRFVRNWENSFCCTSWLCSFSTVAFLRSYVITLAAYLLVVSDL